MLTLYSCTETIPVITAKVIETGEKIRLHTSLYEVGDTVVLAQYITPSGVLALRLDRNWLIFEDNHVCIENDCYFKAVIVK